jgi:hypothetical protein
LALKYGYRLFSNASGCCGIPGIFVAPGGLVLSTKNGGVAPAALISLHQ